MDGRASTSPSVCSVSAYDNIFLILLFLLLLLLLVLPPRLSAHAGVTASGDAQLSKADQFHLVWDLGAVTARSLPEETPG